MRFCGSRVAVGLAVLAALTLAMPGPSHGQATSYLDHDGLTRELRTLTNSSPLATLQSLATTREGREVWMVQVANTSGTPVEERPGILVVGNLEGDHVVGSHLALEAIRYLIANAGEEAVAAALRDHVFYVFPRLNPDVGRIPYFDGGLFLTGVDESGDIWAARFIQFTKDRNEGRKLALYALSAI